MYNTIIIVVSIFSVFDLKNAECAVVFQCYSYQLLYFAHVINDDAVTNIWCEQFCKAADATYQYSGTTENRCYCIRTLPNRNGCRKTFQCTSTCRGNRSEICGGHYVRSYTRVTISEIGLSTENETNTHSHCAASVSLRESTTADFINMIITNASQSTHYTPPTLHSLFSTTTEHAITAFSTLKTETSTQDKTGMRPRKLLCKCPKRLINTKWHFLDGKNITDAEVKKMVLDDFNKNLKSEISVDKKTVSKEIRKKNSSVDKRKSSQSIGWGCIVFLIFPVVFLIAIDILNCCIHFQSRLGDRKRNQIGPTSDIQHSRDSSKPLQENVNITESYYASRCGNDFHPDEVKLETYRMRRDDNNEEDSDKWLQYM